MEQRQEEGEAAGPERGPERWAAGWERLCVAEAGADEPLPPELQEAGAAQREHRQKLWQLFQTSATAVAQLYRDRVRQQPGLALWASFQSAATAVSSLYKESVDAQQRSFHVGVQVGYQRRNKDVLAWVRKRRTVRREDLIRFLCRKLPPPRTARAPPRLPAVLPNRAASTRPSSAGDPDLPPFREAMALHGKAV